MSISGLIMLSNWYLELLATKTCFFTWYKLSYQTNKSILYLLYHKSKLG